jgi:hypothetical protein
MDSSVRTLDAEGVDYVSMVTLLCPGRSCVTHGPDGLPIMFDGEHFTAARSLWAAEVLSTVRGIW